MCAWLDSTRDLDSNFLLSEVVILQYDRSRFITENLLSDAPLMSLEDDWGSGCDFWFVFCLSLSRVVGREYCNENWTFVSFVCCEAIYRDAHII